MAGESANRLRETRSFGQSQVHRSGTTGAASLWNLRRNVSRVNLETAQLSTETQGPESQTYDGECFEEVLNVVFML